MSIFGSSAGETPKFYESISAQEMMDILREMGFAPELSQDSGGDPRIRFQIEGLKNTIFFYGGTEGRYKSLQFFSGFNDKEPLQKVNEWGQKKRYARVYLDASETVNVEWDISLEGGVRKEFIEASVRLWKSLLRGFCAFFA